MRSTTFTSATHAAWALAFLPILRTSAQGMGDLTYSGCYSSSSPLADVFSDPYQTSSLCQSRCVSQNQAVLGLSNGSDCWCGDQLPPANTKVDDSKCNSPCNGFGTDSCGGGTSFFSVYLTGTDTDVSNFGGSSSSSSSANAPPTRTAVPSTTSPATTSVTTKPPQVVTSVSPGTTVVITQPAAQVTGPSSSPSSDTSGGGPNVAGIAAGVVVGVLVILAIAGGAFFFMRRRKREAAEEDYKRNQVNDFMGAGKPPNTGYSQMSDSRLDTEAAAGRRNSVGSIADDQDYSRRILRVANPDDGR